MPKEHASSVSEWLQIAILAGFFTAGGFALVALVLLLFLNPRKEVEANTFQGDYTRLVKLLESKDMKILRQTAKTSEGEEGAKDLREIVQDAMILYALGFKDFGRPTERPLQGMVEITQKIVLNPAPLRSIVQFVTEVEESKKTINVASVQFRKESRGRTENERQQWQATVEFVDYEGR